MLELHDNGMAIKCPSVSILVNNFKFLNHRPTKFSMGGDYGFLNRITDRFLVKMARDGDILLALPSFRK